jgi:hypothetical protein
MQSREESIRSDIRNRLEFAHEYDNKYASMLAFAVPLKDNPQFMQDQAFSLSEQKLPWDAGSAPHVDSSQRARDKTGNERNFPGGDTFYDAYRKKFGLRAITAGQDPASVSAHSFIRNGTHNNSICILGPHRVYSPHNEGKFILVPGQGHFGPDAVAGDARWRRGEAIDLGTSRGAMSGLETYFDAKNAFSKVGLM